MTQLRSARHSRYPSYKPLTGCPCRREGGEIIEQLYQLLGNFRPTARLTLGLVMAHRMAHSWAHFGPQNGSLLGLSWPTARLTPGHRSRGRTIQPHTRPPADARGSGYRQERNRCRQPAYHSAVTHDVTDNIKLISSIVCSVCTRCAVKMHAISSKKHS